MHLHLIVDNYGIHEHPNTTKRLEKYKQFYLHFTPTSSSWLNLIEQWVGKIIHKRIHRGVFQVPRNSSLQKKNIIA
jgi:transposase